MSDDGLSGDDQGPGPQTPAFDEQQARREVKTLLDAGISQDRVSAWFERKYGAAARASAPKATAAPAAAAPDEKGAFSGGDPNLVARGTAADVTRSALAGMTFGLSHKLSGGVDALFDPAHQGGSFMDRYEKYKGGERAAQKEFETDHAKTNFAIQLAAGLVPGLLTGGAGAVAEVGELGAGARALAAAKTGAKIGGAAGFLNADEDASGSGLARRAGQGITEGIFGGALGAGGSALSSAGGAVARKVGATDLLAKLGERVGSARLTALGSKGEAAEQIAARMAREAKAGVAPPTTSDALPTMNINRTGPEVERLAKSILREPGEARAKLGQALIGQGKEINPAQEAEFAALTGQAPARGSAPLAQRLKEQSTETGTAFDAARDATRGQPVVNPEFQKMIETPSGSRAYANAKSMRRDRMNPLPTVEETITVPPPTPAGMSNQDFQAFLAHADKIGMELPAQYRPTIQVVKREVPDAETIHLTKSELGKMAKLGPYDGAKGDLSSDAKAQLNLWQKVRGELDPSFHAADDVASEEYRRSEALEAGRKIFQTPEMATTGTRKQQVGRSLDSVIERHTGSADAEAAQLFREGSGQSGLQKFRTSAPGRDMAKPLAGTAEKRAQLAQAFRSPEDFQQFMNTLTSGTEMRAKRTNLMGGSDTMANLAEAADRGGSPVMANLVKMNFGDALKGVGAGMEKKRMQRLGSDIVDILRSRDAGLLNEVQAKAQIRARMFAHLNRASGVAGVQAFERARPR